MRNYANPITGRERQNDRPIRAAPDCGSPLIYLPFSKPPCFHLAVHGRTSFLRYWLPVILWMAVIFFGSTGLGASHHTSRFIGPFLRWLKPDISDAAVERVQFAVRKTAHITEYAILALLLWRALRQTPDGAPRSWPARKAGAVLLITALYAASDEVHQYFVKSRDASVRDVLLDTGGAALGLAGVWFCGRRRAYW